MIFMGLRNLKQITSTLIEHGRDSQSPAAAIQWGTTEEQVTIVGVLEDIADKVARAGLNAPVLVVIGEVVRLRSMLRWFEEWAPGQHYRVTVIPNALPVITPAGFVPPWRRA